MTRQHSAEQDSTPVELAPARKTRTDRVEQARPRRSRKKPEEVANDQDDVFGQVIAEAQARQAEAAQANAQAHEGHADADEHKAKWLDRFEGYVDDDAGVKVREDRTNKLMTIALRAEPPGQVTDLLADAGWVDDREYRNTWHKHLNDLRPGDTRDEARELAFQAANLIREAEGLPRKQSPYISREGYGTRG